MADSLEIEKKNIKLTQYSHGAGCGCKISPKILDSILKSDTNFPTTEKLLVGNNTRDDAAVYELDNGTAIISTTDFFMPIVDDAFDFGRIASVNAISDVYAMGGTPIMAIAILGFPIDKLPPEIAQQMLEGSRRACYEANIPLAGGHSIDCPEPVFGLAVTGTVQTKYLKKNSTAQVGCNLYLTKPLGVGILTTAEKKGLLKPEHTHLARHWMIQLNKIGAELGKMQSVKALTDVTGFGLLGHLSEMCEGSNLNAIISFNAVPKLEGIDEYIAMKSVPGGTTRNWDSYGHKIAEMPLYYRQILCDPQTSGGLLIAADDSEKEELEALFAKYAINFQPIGKIVERSEEGVYIRVV